MLLCLDSKPRNWSVLFINNIKKPTNFSLHSLTSTRKATPKSIHRCDRLKQTCKVIEKVIYSLFKRKHEFLYVWFLGKVWCVILKTEHQCHDKLMKNLIQTVKNEFELLNFWLIIPALYNRFLCSEENEISMSCSSMTILCFWCSWLR